MVLSGSFLIGGSDDRKGGRKARVRTMNFPNAVQVRADGSRQRGSSRPDRGPRWKQPPGIRAAGPRHGPARLHDWLGRWQVFAPDYTFFCPKVLKPPPSCSLKHGSFWFVASGFVPLPLPSYFPPFPPSLSKKKASPCSIKLKLFSLPFKLLPNFSQTHLYSCHVFLLSQQKYLSNCSSNLPVASLLPSVFPALLLILQNHPFLRVPNEHSSSSQGCSGRVLWVHVQRLGTLPDLLILFFH